MEDYWGGFMKKKISCKVIKSIPLANEEVISSDWDILKIQSLLSFLNQPLTDTSPVIYTNKMKTEKEPADNNLSENVMDFYA